MSGYTVASVFVMTIPFRANGQWNIIFFIPSSVVILKIYVTDSLQRYQSYDIYWDTYTFS
jgi:hypothetical protein